MRKLKLDFQDYKKGDNSGEEQIEVLGTIGFPTNELVLNTKGNGSSKQVSDTRVLAKRNANDKSNGGSGKVLSRLMVAFIVSGTSMVSKMVIPNRPPSRPCRNLELSKTLCVVEKLAKFLLTGYGYLGS